MFFKPTLLCAALVLGTMASQAQTLDTFEQIGRNRVGSFQYDGVSGGGEGYTIVGGGQDIWDRTDECAFAYHEVAGDFDIRVRVTEIQASGQWSKAGIMIRESLAEDAKRAIQSVSPCGLTTQGVNGACNMEFLWRTGALSPGENGGQNSISVQTPAYPNAWIRLVREGSVISGYVGSDGVNWALTSSQDSATWQGGPLPNKALVGLAVSRHPAAGTNQCRAVFRDYVEATPARFCMVADSKGCPDKIFVCYSRPYGDGALNLMNYAIQGDVFPQSVAAGSNPKEVVITMETMTEGGTYTVTATGVKDAQGNDIDGACSSSSFVHAKGYEKRRIHVQHNKNFHDPASDTLVARLDSTAYRLGQGAWTLGFPPFEGNTVFEDPLPDSGSNERFSSRVVGVLSPAADMTAIFAMSSDDFGALYLGSNDQPSSKVQIASEPAWNGRREYAAGGNQASRGVPPANISGPQTLVGGNKYYLEVVYSEGGGGNNGSATWDAGTGAPIVNGQSPIEEANFVDSRFAYGHIFYNLGAPAILAQPQNQTVAVGATATFSMVLDGSPPYKIIWRKNGTPIPGARGATLSLSNVQASDNGATISATVSNACGGVVSANATLNVILNPVVLRATSKGNCHVVYVQYNQPMQLNGTYSMICSNNDGTITPAVLTGIRHGVDMTEICFNVAPDLQPDTNTYYITVTGAQSTGGLTVNPNPTTVSFKHGGEYPLSPITFKKYTGINFRDLDPTDVPVETRLNQPFLESPSNIDDNYVGQTFGTWIVPNTGTYRFWMAADDPGVTFVSTDANPASKVEVAREPQWAGIRQFASCDRRTCVDGIPQENQSPPFNLTAGQRVYVEVVFQEFGGGDNSAVAVSYDDPNTVDVDESRTPPANGASPLPANQFLQTRIGPDGTAFTTLCDVFCNPGPSDQTVFIGFPATFNATPDGTPPYQLSWKKNGVVIPGATGASYTTPPTTAADEGTVYTFVVANGFSTNECSATLHVRREPVVLACDTRGHPVNVYITYNKPVKLDGTYSIVDDTEGFPVGVQGVAHGSSQSEVVLTTDGLPADHGFTLTITGVHDQETTPAGGNLIVPDPTICKFAQGPGRLCADFNDNMLPMGTVGGGTAAPTVVDGSLRLTQNGVTSQQNTWTIPLGGVQTFDCLTARWKALLNGPVGNAADGYSFNVGQNLTFPVAAEEGGNNGLSVTVDTFDNGGAEVGIEVRWNGSRIGFTQIGGGTTHGPAALMRNQFVDASLDVTPSGLVTFNYDTFTVSAQIPNFTGINANQYVFAARTGGAAEDAWIDDVCINDYTLGPIAVSVAPQAPSVAECGTLTFTATATGSPCHYFQWFRNGVAIPGARNATYTTPPLTMADDGAMISVTASNEFSNASASSTIDVIPDNTAPTIVSVGALNSSTIGVCFTEAVDPASATTPANYSINGGAAGAGISSIAVRPDGRSVVITLSTPLTTCAFSVSSTGVLDACPARNSANSSANGTVIGLTGVDVGTPGDPAPAGTSFSCANGVVELTAGGSDIWGTADHGQFAYTTRVGDFDMKVKVESLEFQNTWSKAGLMARVTLDAGSPMVTTYHTPITGANQIEAGARATPGGNVADFAPMRPVAANFPWIGLRRTGSELIASHSADGMTWIDHATTGPVAGLPASLLVGLAATSHNNGVATKAVFSNFTLNSSVNIVRSGGQVTVSWPNVCDRLQAAPSITGPWTDITGGSPQNFDTSGPMRFFRTIRP